MTVMHSLERKPSLDCGAGDSAIGCSAQVPAEKLPEKKTQ
jgi:hypothetical protein